MRVPHSKNAVHGSPGEGDPDDDPVHPDGAHGIREGDPRPYPEDPKPKPLLWNHQSSGTNDSRSVHEGWVVTLHPHRKNGLQTGALPPTQRAVGTLLERRTPGTWTSRRTTWTWPGSLARRKGATRSRGSGRTTRVRFFKSHTPVRCEGEAFRPRLSPLGRATACRIGIGIAGATISHGLEGDGGVVGVGFRRLRCTRATWPM